MRKREISEIGAAYRFQLNKKKKKILDNYELERILRVGTDIWRTIRERAALYFNRLTHELRVD